MNIRRRRAWNIDKGHSLFFNEKIQEYEDRLQAFTENTGIAPEHLITHPVIKTPVPSYLSDSPRQEWGVRPEAMWHPLMWLPQRLQLPTKLTIGGVERAEKIPPYLLRIAVEMSMSAPYEECGRYWVNTFDVSGIPIQDYATDENDNLIVPDEDYDYDLVKPMIEATSRHANLLAMYDPKDATWLDVPYLVGVDLLTEEGVKRMRSWLAGNPDPALDSINLDDYLTTPDRDPLWAYSYLYRELDLTLVDPTDRPSYGVEDLANAQYFFCANDAFDMVRQALEECEKQPHRWQELVEPLAGISTFLTTVLPAVGDDTDLGIPLLEADANLIRATTIDDALDNLGALCDLIDVFCEIFAPYPERNARRTMLETRDRYVHMVNTYGMDPDVLMSDYFPALGGDGND